MCWVLPGAFLEPLLPSKGRHQGAVLQHTNNHKLYSLNSLKSLVGCWDGRPFGARAKEKKIVSFPFFRATASNGRLVTGGRGWSHRVADRHRWLLLLLLPSPNAVLPLSTRRSLGEPKRGGGDCCWAIRHLGRGTTTRFTWLSQHGARTRREEGDTPLPSGVLSLTLAQVKRARCSGSPSLEMFTTPSRRMRPRCTQ